jgi:hypothetical protein
MKEVGREKEMRKKKNRRWRREIKKRIKRKM